MSNHGKWPRDVHPQVVRRAQEVSRMSLTDAKRNLRKLARQNDFNMVQAISKIIKGWEDPDHQADGELFLRMFEELYDDADRAENLLKSAEPRNRSAVLQEILNGYQRKYNRQILPVELFVVYVDADKFGSWLRAGLDIVRTRWNELTRDEKELYVFEVFQQPFPKGYPRAKKAAERWKPPREIAGASDAINRWFNGETSQNQNLYAGFSLPPKADEKPMAELTPMEQIGKMWTKFAPGSRAYLGMWTFLLSNIFFQQLRVKFEWDPANEAIRGSRDSLIGAFRTINEIYGVIGDPTAAVDSFLNNHLETVLEDMYLEKPED